MRVFDLTTVSGMSTEDRIADLEDEVNDLWDFVVMLITERKGEKK